MLDGTYVLQVDSPLGKKEGMVKLSTNGSVVEADIDAPLIGKQHVIGKADGDTFTAQGAIKILFMGKVEYDLQGEVSGDVISMTIRTSKGDAILEGTRL